jgi:hypothetical protein
MSTHRPVLSVRVKVNLPLCLTKHHAMKTYWGSGDIAPRIEGLNVASNDVVLCGIENVNK